MAASRFSPLKAALFLALLPLLQSQPLVHALAPRAPRSVAASSVMAHQPLVDDNDDDADNNEAAIEGPPYSRRTRADHLERPGAGGPDLMEVEREPLPQQPRGALAAILWSESPNRATNSPVLWGPWLSSCGAPPVRQNASPSNDNIEEEEEIHMIGGPAAVPPLPSFGAPASSSRCSVSTYHSTVRSSDYAPQGARRDDRLNQEKGPKKRQLPEELLPRRGSQREKSNNEEEGLELAFGPFAEGVRQHNRRQGPLAGGGRRRRGSRAPRSSRRQRQRGGSGYDSGAEEESASDREGSSK